MNQIRTLRADEIECRVATVKVDENRPEKSGCSLLLYKDARCDMRILDEVFGPMGWTRHHEEIGGRLYCTISVLDKDTGQWISKQDVGTESNAEKEKGQASDSFKRAGFNWGIGRELYTAPFIWVNLAENETYKRGQSYTVKTQFHVAEIDYNDKREICRLVIHDRKGKRYEFGATQQTVKERISPEEFENLKDMAKQAGCGTPNKFYKATGVRIEDAEKMTKEEFEYIVRVLSNATKIQNG